MFDSKQLGVLGPDPDSPLRGVRKRFGDLEVRPKLMILHNLFFLVLACAVYFSLVSIFEEQIAQSRARELDLVRSALQIPRAGQTSELLKRYQYREGQPGELSVTPEAMRWLAEHPGGVWVDPERGGTGFFRRAPGRYARVEVPEAVYSGRLTRAKLTLFVVLGSIYVLAVGLLEFLIMPLYVYRPLSLMLRADAATRKGERDRELIDGRLILRDEIGQIMRSRNATVAELRRREDELERVNHDLKQKNEMLENARLTLAEQDRLASLGLLSASVAHELNTPLSVLRGSVEKLGETVSGAANQSRIERILRVTGRLQKICETLLDFSRPRQPAFHAVELRPVVDEAWELVRIDERGAQIHFRNEIPAGLEVHGDASRLNQVFVNLLRNALHEVPPRGHISVHADAATAHGRPWIITAVEDDGPGIPPDLLPNIFDAFVSTRLDSKGTGLGLTVAEGIVQQHGGTIRASNRPGGGARIEVRLPAEPAEVHS